MSLQFHWNNLEGYTKFILNSKKIAKLCLLQNYKLMADTLNNSLVPFTTENHMKMVMGHTEFIVVHVLNMDIEGVILNIKQRDNELLGDYRDRVRPHIINLVKQNALLLENVKAYNENVEKIKKERVKIEFDDLLLINF